jgi:hypothetical protein
MDGNEPGEQRKRSLQLGVLRADGGVVAPNDQLAGLDRFP